ncbi:MAG: HNH endonuclease signature motif containing protein [Pseudolabrys sp.]|nr:HNH endonuclease signature motif containing protein [Pseudolabrys sp.]
MDQIEPKYGDSFEGVLLETFRDDQVSRPRVKPVAVLPSWLKVEFPRHLREANPIGTLFRADVYVRQKHYPDGAPKGPLYLRANNNTIIKIAEPTSDKVQIAVQRRGTISGRAYDYFIIQSSYDSVQKRLFALRGVAYGAPEMATASRSVASIRRERSALIVEYARLRSEGFCEACDSPAPFIRRNDDPYLEVHHIVSLAEGGEDHPKNVVAICPNCHARVTHGKDGVSYNSLIKKRVVEIEAGLMKITTEG